MIEKGTYDNTIIILVNIILAVVLVVEHLFGFWWERKRFAGQDNQIDVIWTRLVD